jgi:DNA-binding NarL/FixJ family response regulator
MEAAAVLKNLMPRMPIVMLTFHDDQIKAVPASAFGIKAVVSKADGMSKLIECLDGLVGREAPANSGTQREACGKRNNGLTPTT